MNKMKFICNVLATTQQVFFDVILDEKESKKCRKVMSEISSFERKIVKMYIPMIMQTIAATITDNDEDRKLIVSKLDTLLENKMKNAEYTDYLEVLDYFLEEGFKEYQKYHKEPETNETQH